MIRTCRKCGTRNRVPARHLADQGKCGSCKSPLPALDEPVSVGQAEFDEITKNARVPVLVDFWASWCDPCRMAAPDVEAIAREMSGRSIVLKVDTEEHPELAARFRVQSIPNFLVLRDGNVVMQQAGVAPRTVMRQWLEDAAAA